MSTIRTYSSAIAAIALSSMATSAGAYEKGDWLLKVGWAMVAPNDGSGALEVDGVDDPLGLGKDVIAVENGQAAGFSATYMFNSLIGLELLASTPFEHDIVASGDLKPVLEGALGSADIGSTRHLPPTLTVQYYPMGHSKPNSPWQPYIGAGINFTWFYDEKIDGTFYATGARDSDFSLSNSVGPAAIIGLDYAFKNGIILNGSIMYAGIETEAEINNVDLGLGAPVTLKADVDVNPWVYRLNFGYRFGGSKSKAAPVAAAAVPVAAAAVAVGDSDNDGVKDDIDECPNTIEGALIDDVGCGVKLTGAHFKFDSDELNPDAITLLNDLAVRMKQYPEVNLLVEGHTDTSGDEAYNVNLSERRAQAAANYLESQGVDASRLEVVGLGSSQPVADNATKEGREANRRVVFKKQ